MVTNNEHSEVLKSFLNTLGDKKFSLWNKVIEYNNIAVLILLVRISVSSVLKVLAISFDNTENRLSDIQLFDYMDNTKIEKFVSDRIPYKCYDMGKITAESDSNVEYLLKDNIVYYSGPEEKCHEKVADISEFSLNTIINMFEYAKSQGIQPCKIKIEGSFFWCINKDIAYEFLGKDKNNACLKFAELGMIYFKKESANKGKIRYYYRSRTTNADGSENYIDYFAVRAEFYDYSSKGGIALSA
ncbi:MAG: hypothetical protein NC452_16075 [Eubacterium sp.]|nr:hypothetical protein [Eubacterium sp.]